jgi:hypothetical protein
MPKKSSKGTKKSWMPAASSIVSEIEFVPAKPAVAGVAVARRVSRYRILRTSEVDPYDKRVPRAAVTALGVPKAAPPGDKFQGTARRAAKLSIPGAQLEDFNDLQDLIATLPAHKAMKNHKPKITTQASSKRVSEEKRNTKVSAFLYAASREDDNDFHLIIGRKPGPSLLFMTAEISGLPSGNANSFARLNSARNAYKGFFAANLPNETYDFYDPPIPIEIQGSLFFDMSHATGSRPGPSKLRPHMPVVWELHPVTKIVFEP